MISNEYLNNYKVEILSNIECIIYNMINKTLIKLVCNKLYIEFIILDNSRFLKVYNEQLVSNFITHVIYSTITINKHAKQICFMFIVSFDNYRIIIDKS